ncbi:membrane protein insertase YidC [Streptomyces erythrochromogenes]|uniref:membrane protein insertase YidC n=1 Tax=Streptomyces erythrochromogenes TaxID=285574 RepID=UPI003423F7E8
MSVYGIFADFVSWLSGALAWVFAASATAAAIVLVTVLVRAALHPLNRAVFRGERARAALAPRLAELRRLHPGRRNPDRSKAVRELYAQSGTSPMAGCLPMLLQTPVFLVMNHAFSADRIDGQPNTLLREVLFGAPLGSHWRDVLAGDGWLSRQGLVYLGLFAAHAAVAWWTVVRARHAAATGFGPVLPAEDEPGAALIRRIVPLMPLMAFGTLVMAAFVPLAVGLYLLASTAWTTGERGRLRRRWARAGAGAVGRLRGRHRRRGGGPGRHRRHRRHRRPRGRSAGGGRARAGGTLLPGQAADGTNPSVSRTPPGSTRRRRRRSAR